MDAPCRIRPGSLADAPALAELERACFSDPWTAAGIRETIQYETSRSFVALESDRIVGYVIARISGMEGEILDLAVLPEVRRRGIALLNLARNADPIPDAASIWIGDRLRPRMLGGRPVLLIEPQSDGWRCFDQKRPHTDGLEDG